MTNGAGRASGLIALGEPGEGLRTLDLRVRIDASRAPAASGEVEALWEAQRAVNPRLFNAPVLSIVAWDEPTITVRRETYQRLTAQTHDPALVEPRIDQLSVTGVLHSVDRSGTRHVLVARRSASTRIHGGLWEFAPGGGVDAPPPSMDELDGGDLFRQLLVEIREELDLPSPATADLAPGRAIALTPDAHAGSTDVVICVELGARVEDLLLAGAGDERWEYDGTRWVTLDELAAWQSSDPTAFITPALDLGSFVTRHGIPVGV